MMANMAGQYSEDEVSDCLKLFQIVRFTTEQLDIIVDLMSGIKRSVDEVLYTLSTFLVSL